MIPLLTTKRNIVLLLILLPIVHILLQKLTPIYNYLPFLASECTGGSSNPALGCVLRPVFSWEYFISYLFVVTLISSILTFALSALWVKLKRR